MSDISDLSKLITSKSDQLNADDLVGSSKVITVTKVKVVSSDQPLIIYYEGDDGRPYKPCLTMRRILTHKNAWGTDGRTWTGKQMKLYRDDDVTFGEKGGGLQKVGGIRISHLSHIQKRLSVMLAKSRGKKVLYEVDPLIIEPKAKPPYPFDKGYEKLKEYILSGDYTAEQLITKCQETHTLTEEQRKLIRQIEEMNDESPD